MGSNGEFIPVLDAAGETIVREEYAQFTTFWTNFFVQSVVEERHEKQQIVETFGESFIFFFGEAPRVLNVQGLLLNTADFNWRAEFWENYERYFRGTRLVEKGARLYLIYDDIIVEGYMMSANATENTNLPQVISFSFQIFVTGHTNVSSIGDPLYPHPPGSIDYTQISSYSEAVKNWEDNRNLQRELSTEAVAEANRSAYLGSGSMISSMIRDGIITTGDPSVAGFLERSMKAISTISTVINSANTYTKNAGTGTETTRAIPIRSAFTDNTDEFIGGSEQGPSVNELASPLSMAEKWLAADRSIDASVVGMVTSAMTTIASSTQQLVEDSHPTETQEFWDLMGRAGRASEEIRQSGGHRNRTVNITRGLTIGDNYQPRPPILAREVPYGMIVSSGDMV
jgi:hypothetical protein